MSALDLDFDLHLDLYEFLGLDSNTFDVFEGLEGLPFHLDDLKGKERKNRRRSRTEAKPKPFQQLVIPDMDPLYAEEDLVDMEPREEDLVPEQEPVQWELVQGEPGLKLLTAKSPKVNLTDFPFNSFPRPRRGSN